MLFESPPIRARAASKGRLAPARGSDIAGLAELLRHHAAGTSPDSVDSICEPLDLAAYGCVLSRRSGVTPSPNATHSHMQALAGNLVLRRTLSEAAAALSGAGVAAIVYKGQDYLERVYADLGARPMADIDLLVDDKQIARAHEALIAAGFRFDPDCEREHERKFCKDGVAVDLHRWLVQPLRTRIVHEELLERALPCPFAEGLLILETTDALVVHCVNQMIKGYHLPPSSYLELQALLRAADLQVALARAVRWSALSAMYASMRVLGLLGNTRARKLAGRAPLSKARRIMLDRVIAHFARQVLGRPRPCRATLLVIKTLLIDEPPRAARFLGRWLGWELASRGPPHARTPRCDTTPRRDHRGRTMEAKLAGVGHRWYH